MATIESIAMLFVFVVLFAYTIGMFAAVHTGILNSIAARSYAFETFRHRTDLVYFRDEASSINANFKKYNYRFHGVRAENASGDTWVVTQRNIQWGLSGSDESQGVPRNLASNHSVSNVIATGMEKDQANPIWIKTIYGICLNARCSP